jgi:hypothetical protein
VRPVPEAFVDAVKPFVSRQVWAMIELQRRAGMRPTETCVIRTIDINMSGRIWEYTPVEKDGAFGPGTCCPAWATSSRDSAGVAQAERRGVLVLASRSDGRALGKSAERAKEQGATIAA